MALKVQPTGTAVNYRKETTDVKVQVSGTGTATRKEAISVLWQETGTNVSGRKLVWERFDSTNEFFTFTIDTRQTQTNLSGTDTTFSIPTSNVYAYNWEIDWGEGDSTQTVTGIGANTRYWYYQNIRYCGAVSNYRT